ncbi:MAG: hypothetical protein J0J14_15065 [Hyphomicrobium sp.]|uniref:hypothetical protein n=1 Tax=Hyphomicrobium sp. CS1BSMeth3 TaxID=1892844 RepID=UPI00086C1742|nr:hypothetical protein [Hyphomicrobium sp. CS1BSMeth3]MBN9262166.1 hypothetical protein [Hyphomicrobium sp.]MBN9263511.1 hypothetical protein [Hyphomicrobium sp.]ODT21784.1 MAG: hypothetical protein ABS54_12165 [Hyphomicrobium sp. SCN 65-11]
MKTILSALVAVGVLAGAAHAQAPAKDPFYDPSLALPHSEFGNDDFRQALPHAPQVSDDEYRQALPLADPVLPDNNIATP